MKSSQLTSNDLAWAANAILVRLGLSAIPVGCHIKYAILRGAVSRRLHGIPESVVENLEVMFKHLSTKEIQSIAHKYVDVSQQTRLKNILPLHYGIHASRHWRIEGENNLDKVLEFGRGALLVTAHFGLARLIGPLLRCKNYEVLRLVADPLQTIQRRQRWLRWLQSRNERARRWAEVLLMDLLRPHDIGASLDIRPILAALSENKCIMVAGDGLVGAEFTTTSFFGHPYPVPTGFMKIALARGTHVLPTFASMRDPGEVVVEIHPPVELDPGATLQLNIAKVIWILEERVRQSPYQFTRLGTRKFFERALTWSGVDLEEREGRLFERWARDIS